MRQRLHDLQMNVLYPLYLQKILRKGRLESELLDILSWMTGYDRDKIKDLERTLESFFNHAPKITKDVSLITGKICGVDIETIEDLTYRYIRQMDKIVDELAKGKTVESITKRKKTS